MEIEPNRLGRLVEELAAAGLDVSGDAAREAVRYAGQFNAIDPETRLLSRVERTWNRVIG